MNAGMWAEVGVCVSVPQTGVRGACLLRRWHTCVLVPVVSFFPSNMARETVACTCVCTSLWTRSCVGPRGSDSLRRGPCRTVLERGE